MFVFDFAKGVDFARNRLSFANSLPTRCLLGDKPAAGCICLLKQACKDFALNKFKANVQILQNEMCLHLLTVLRVCVRGGGDCRDSTSSGGASGGGGGGARAGQSKDRDLNNLQHHLHHHNYQHHHHLHLSKSKQWPNRNSSILE